MDLCSLMAWFGLFSFFGWVYECTYCAIKNRRWDNRGFLFGPVCPIYGCGVVLVILVAGLLPSLGTGVTPQWWHIFLGASLGSAILEYSTSYLLEKFFHARWWDYSRVPLNLNGRICLPFALCFGAVGTLLYYYVYPWVTSTSGSISPGVCELLGLVVASLMSADLALTLSALKDLDSRVERGWADFDAVMDTAVDDITSGRRPLQPDVEEATRRAAEGMSAIQRRALRSIRRFTTEKKEAGAARLRGALERINRERKNAAEHLPGKRG